MGPRQNCENSKQENEIYTEVNIQRLGGLFNNKSKNRLIIANWKKTHRADSQKSVVCYSAKICLLLLSDRPRNARSVNAINLVR